VKVDPLVGAGAGALLTLVVIYVSVGGKFPFTRTPMWFVLSCLLAFVVGFAVLAALTASQP
jgi:hypothetical protein